MAVNKTDNYYYEIVRKNIRNYRREKGFTQEELAEAAGLSADYIGEIESQRSKKVLVLQQLVRYLKL